MRTSAMMIAAHDAPSSRRPSAEAREGRTLAPPSYGLSLFAGRASQKLQLKPRIGDSGDPFEREADRLADVVVNGGFAGPVSRAAPGAAQCKCEKCEAEDGIIQRKCSACEEETVRRSPAAAGSAGGSAEAAARAVSSGGSPLGLSERAFFAKGFGRDFSDVRIHSGPGAGAAALAIGARAYTLGRDIAFAPGEYAPEQPAGRRLLAHELAHVAQQGGAGETIRRAELQIVGADVSGPLTVNQRRAAASCPISCAGQVPAAATPAQVAAAASVTVGTLHAMPVFFHASRGAILPSAAGANGIGTSLHFIRNSTAPPAGNPCTACTDWKIIQILRSNEPSDARGNQSFVDNNSGATPFYDDAYAGGSGLHTVPVTNYPESGNDMRTTRSIYDRPFRGPASLALVAGHDFFWEAEACVTCVKPGRHKLLGCATYGFRRAWVPTAPAPGSPPPAPGAPPAGAHGPVQVTGPGCRASPSAHFAATLRSDPSTSGYQFDT